MQNPASAMTLHLMSLRCDQVLLAQVARLIGWQRPVECFLSSTVSHDTDVTACDWDVSAIQDLLHIGLQLVHALVLPCSILPHSD